MTDTLALYLKSIGFGLAVAAPVGPMALLCMRRTLIQGWRHGLATGFGIASADGIYALVAALGLSGISAFMHEHEQFLHLAAGSFLLYLGLKAFFAWQPSEDADSTGSMLRSWPSSYSSSVLLTLTNPPTIIMFAAIFAALAPKSGFSPPVALLTVAGVFTGSLLWWCGVTVSVSAFRHAIGPKARRRIDRIAGVVLAFFGLAELRQAMIPRP